MSQTYPSGMDPAVYDTAMGGTAAGILLVLGLFFAWAILLMICSMMGIFIKANKPWWAALIPIYNLVVLLEIVGKPIWWLLFMFVPIANFVVSILIAHSLSRSFGKDAAYTAGLVLAGIVFYPMLAFGSARYQGHPA